MGMPAIAITDHGNVFGAYDFWKKATEAGIKPIIGIEAYVTPGTHRARQDPGAVGRRRRATTSPARGAYTHMTLLAETTEGMHNLFRLSSLASHRGLLLQAAHGPRAAADLRAGPHRDHRLPGGRGPDPAAARPVRRGASRRRPSSATSSARRTTSSRSWTTGSTSSAGSWTTCCGSPRTSTCRSSRPTTCTTRTPRTRRRHEALLCVQSGSTLDDPNRFKFDGDEFYLKTPERDAPAVRASTPRPATTRC